MLKVVKCSFIILAAFILSSCSKEQMPVSASSGLPSVTTGNAVAIASDSAVVSGNINPNGNSATYFFQFGKDTVQGINTTKTVAVGSDQQPININDVLTKLTPNSRYFYRAAARNINGTSFGQFKSFTTDVPKADYFQHFAVGDSSLWSYSDEVKETTTHSTEIKGVVLWKVISISSSNGITTTTIQRKFTGSRYTFDAIAPWDTTSYTDDISYFTIQEDENHNINLDLKGQGGKVNFNCWTLNFNRYQLDSDEEITLPASTEIYSSFALSKKYGFIGFGKARIGMTGSSVSYRLIH